MQSSADLKNLLDRIDHRGYPAYKDTKGEYQFPGYVLSIDHVQGDPFAAPSKLSIHVKGKTAAFPKELYQERRPRIALQDGLTRLFGRQAEQVSFKVRGSGQSGLISVSRCGQEILERTACAIDPKSGDLILRLEVGFPANGRTINSREMEKILFEFLPGCVKNSLFYSNLDAGRLRAAAVYSGTASQAGTLRLCGQWEYPAEGIRRFLPPDEKQRPVSVAEGAGGRFNASP